MKAEHAAPIARRHLRVGWWSLFVFVVLGAVLEAFHAVKLPAYLDAGNETRRLLFRLAHAHGTLVALVNVAFGLTARAHPEVASEGASRALLAALVLLPVGFFAGGVSAHGGDPGLGVVLVPAGAAALGVGIVLVARRV